MGACQSLPKEVPKKPVKKDIFTSYPPTDIAKDKKDAYTNWGKNPSDYIYR
jgi:hypothetical protein